MLQINSLLGVGTCWLAALSMRAMWNTTQDGLVSSYQQVSFLAKRTIEQAIVCSVIASSISLGATTGIFLSKKISIAKSSFVGMIAGAISGRISMIAGRSLANQWIDVYSPPNLVNSGFDAEFFAGLAGMIGGAFLGLISSATAAAVATRKRSNLFAFSAAVCMSLLASTPFFK